MRATKTLRHIMNMQEVDYENKKTMALLGITYVQLKKLLLTETHSELRTGLDLEDVMFKKKLLGTKGILDA